VKNKNRGAAAGGESFARGSEVAGESVGLADSIVAKEAIGSLGIRSVLTCPWSCCSNSARQLFQQLSQSLAVADILELASRHFIFYPPNRLAIPQRLPAFHAMHRSSIPHGNHFAMLLQPIVST
jgi:hypothetical protein